LAGAQSQHQTLGTQRELYAEQIPRPRSRSNRDPGIIPSSTLLLVSSVSLTSDGKPISRQGAADILNERNVPTTRGGRWNEHQLYRVARRLGIDPPVARPPRKVTRARVHAIWKQHPQVTAREIKQSLAPDIPLREQAISRLLKECRLGVAKRCPVQIPKVQYLDSRTVLRVRIAQIWRRHPEYTGKQVLHRLGLEHPVPLQWVQHVLKDCWLAETRHSPAQRMKGPANICSAPRLWSGNDAGS